MNGASLSYNAAPVIVPNIVRALVALGFCIGGRYALIAAVVCRRSDLLSSPTTAIPTMKGEQR